MLVSCVAYEDGRKIADIPVADVSEYVHRPSCFVWVAMFEPTQGELDEIAREFDLHELAVEDARKGHQRPKIEEYGDSLFAVQHPAEIVRGEDGTDELRIGEVDIFVGVNYVLTVRHRTQLGFAGVRARTEREPELLRHGAGVASVHDLHVWHMSASHAALSAHVAIEDGTQWPRILADARTMLATRFQIDHVTLQPSWPASPPFGDRRVIPITPADGG